MLQKPKNPELFDLVEHGCSITIGDITGESGRPFVSIIIPGSVINHPEDWVVLFDDYLLKKPDAKRSARQAAWTRALKTAQSNLDTLLEKYSEPKRPRSSRKA